MITEEQIQTEGGLYLRKLRLTDAELLHTAFSDEDSATYFTQKKYKNFHDTKTLVAWLCSVGDYFTVVREKGDQVIGLIGTRPVKDKPGVVRLAYVIHKRYRGRGIMPEVIRALTVQVFQNGKVNRIEATIRPDNVKSLRCIEKAGYHMERVIEAEANQPDTGDDELLKRRILYVCLKTNTGNI